MRIPGATCGRRRERRSCARSTPPERRSPSSSRKATLFQRRRTSAGTGSGDAGWVCIHRLFIMRVRTYCPKAPRALLSGECRLTMARRAGLSREEAMYARLYVHRLTVNVVTRNDDRDEVYFVVNGSIDTYGGAQNIRIPRVPQPPHTHNGNDYYGLHATEVATDIDEIANPMTEFPSRGGPDAGRPWLMHPKSLV